MFLDPQYPWPHQIWGEGPQETLGNPWLLSNTAGVQENVTLKTNTNTTPAATVGLGLPTLGFPAGDVLALVQRENLGPAQALQGPQQASTSSSRAEALVGATDFKIPG